MIGTLPWGYIYFQISGVPVDWQSRKQSVLRSLFTAEAEDMTFKIQL